MLSTGEDTQVVMQTVRVSANRILHATKIIGQRTWKIQKNTCIIQNESNIPTDDWNSPVVLYHILVVCSSGEIHHHKEIAADLPL